MRLKLKKNNHLLILLRNAVSDLLCCLDNLEAGHDRTLDNNLRMIFEDYCLALNIRGVEEAYELFLKGKLQASTTVTFAKKKEGLDSFGRLYGFYSDISHHKDYNLLARQVVCINGKVNHFSHLKSIDKNRLYVQLNKLLMISLLLRLIGEEAEKIGAVYNVNLYFLEKSEDGYIKNLNIPENHFMMRLIEEYNKHRNIKKGEMYAGRISS